MWKSPLKYLEVFSNRMSPILFFSNHFWFPLIVHGEKKIVVLTNQIVDIELTKLFCFPKKFSVFQTNLFVEPTNESVTAFCSTKLFVRRTKILLKWQKKVLFVSSIFSPCWYSSDLYFTPCNWRVVELFPKL